jgi:hypothetical protein
MLFSSNAVLIGYVVYHVYIYHAVYVVYYALRKCIDTSIHAVAFECSEPLSHGVADKKTYFLKSQCHSKFTTQKSLCRGSLRTETSFPRHAARRLCPAGPSPAYKCTIYLIYYINYM